MKNYMTRTLAHNKQARILFVENTDIIREICHRHNMPTLLRTLLARTVSCSSMLTGLLKDNHRISLKIQASRRDYCVHADVDAAGNIRGYLNDALMNIAPEEISRCSIEQFLGKKGCIRVVTDIGMYSHHTGITDLPHGNITDDISYFYAQSEQTPTWISLFMDWDENNEIVVSRGVLAQLLPNAPLTLLHQIKQDIDDHRLMFSDPSYTETMSQLPYIIFPDAEVLEKKPLQLFCGCSKEMFYPMLYALGFEELHDAYQSKKTIEFACNVCGNRYSFIPEELAQFISSSKHQP